MDATHDGRNIRRRRNRDAVLAAVIDLFEDGDSDPSIDLIAARAGVSNRSVYRYFEHRDDLIRTAVARALGLDSTTQPAPVDTDAPLEDRIRAFVDDRMTGHHRSLQIVRAARLSAATEPLIAEQFAADRERLRARLLQCFAPELDGLDDDERSRCLLAIELLFQFDSIDFLLMSTSGRRHEVSAILADQLCLQLDARADRGVLSRHG